jgi:hypothetical protein
VKIASVVGTAVALAVGTGSAVGHERSYVATCADAVYKTPVTQPPPSDFVLRLGPVVFNDLAPRAQAVTPPATQDGFFNVASFINVMPSAAHGVTIRLVGGDAADRLSAGRVRGARAIRFAVCRDPETNARLISQYGLSILMRKPTCFTVEVQPVGSTRRYRATVAVRALHC